MSVGGEVGGDYDYLNDLDSVRVNDIVPES